MKKHFLIGLFILTAFYSYPQDCNIYFDFNSDVMRINDVGKLHELISQYAQNKKLSFLLTGNTDSVGNEKYNLELSKRRAVTIKKYLVQNKVDSAHIKMEFFGKKKLVSTDQFYNRRVEIYLTEKTTAESFNYKKFVSSLKPKKEVFNIPTNTDIEIEGKKGTVISFPKNAFVYRNGKSVEGNVKIELTEFYSISDFFSDRLSTVANGNLLSSGGMVCVKAYKDTAELKLKNDVDIEVDFPKSFDNTFYTFYGERHTDGSMNWLPDKRQLAQGKIQDPSATFSDDGNSLIATDKKTADERNKKIQYDRINGGFKVLNEQEKKELAKYYEEQKKIDSDREKYYNVLKSNKLNYINCDRVNKDSSSTVVNYSIEIENPEITCLSSALIFKKTNGFLEMSKATNKMYIINARLSLKEPIILLVVGQLKDKIYIYHEQVTLSANKTEKVTLTESSAEELENILRQM